MTLFVIVPLSRPTYLSKVLGHLKFQTFKDWRLILVENGNGVGSSSGIELPEGTVVLSSKSGMASYPRNVGMEWVKSNGGGFLTFMDDDDYYGPMYLEETWGVMQKNPKALVGKSLRWVRFEDGLHYCLNDDDLGTKYYFNYDQLGLTGGACGGHSSQMKPFPLLSKNEDYIWGTEAKARGVRVINIGPKHFIYNRIESGNRLLKLTKTQFLFTFGPSFFYGDAPDEISWEFPKTTCEFFTRPTEDDILQDLIKISDAIPFDPNLFKLASINI